MPRSTPRSDSNSRSEGAGQRDEPCPRHERPRRLAQTGRETSLPVPHGDVTPNAVEQVFLERRGGRVEVLLVLEDDAGGRSRERLPLPTSDLSEATRWTARRLAQRGIRPARKLRLRVAGGDDLRDDEVLLDLFLTELRRGDSSGR